MQDGIMKGTGNSRYLKSIADFLTQYPTYQEFAAALVAGTLPVDLVELNEKNGGRHQSFVIENEDLVRAGTINELQVR